MAKRKVPAKKRPKSKMMASIRALRGDVDRSYLMASVLIRELASKVENETASLHVKVRHSTEAMTKHINDMTKTLNVVADMIGGIDGRLLAIEADLSTIVAALDINKATAALETATRKHERKDHG